MGTIRLHVKKGFPQWAHQWTISIRRNIRPFRFHPVPFSSANARLLNRADVQLLATGLPDAQTDPHLEAALCGLRNSDCEHSRLDIGGYRLRRPIPTTKAVILIGVGAMMLFLIVAPIVILAGIEKKTDA